MHLVFAFVKFVVFMSIRRFIILVVLLAGASMVFAKKSNGKERMTDEERNFARQVVVMIDKLPDISVVDRCHVQWVDNVNYAMSLCNRAQRRFIGKRRIWGMVALTAKTSQIARADSISEALRNLPKTIELVDSARIFDICRSYKSLDDFGLSYLSPLSVVKYERVVNQMSGMVAVYEFCDKLDSILQEDLIDNRKIFADLELQFDSFSADEKNFIPPYLYRRFELLRYQSSGLQKFDRAVEIIPKNVTLDCAGKIQKAREIYDEMGVSLRKKVNKPLLHKLQHAESALATLRYKQRIDSVEIEISPAEQQILDILNQYDFVIYFGYSKVVYGPTSRQLVAIRKIIEVLRTNPDVKLLIHGYASADGGGVVYNESVAYERAMSVKAQFELYGAAQSQLEVICHVDNLSADVSIDEDEHEKNRKVAFSTRLNN